ncbi:hypothetical protein ACJJTC_016810, partial [Scirpophaga incertulas]
MAEDVGASDAALLSPLTEDSFLHNLHVRYKRDIIYTYAGNAVVCVNPCIPLPLYSAEAARAYVRLGGTGLPPHIYGAAAVALRRARSGRAAALLLTGDSGAGKTEAARVCLQLVLLAVPAPLAPTPAPLAAAGTLLEAFGNAATARNHNASRFGKLLDIEFDFRGVPVSGNISICKYHLTVPIINKSRVCSVPTGERNFHVLYQLLAGADAHLLKRLKLQRSWEQYRILRGGGDGDGDGDASGEGDGGAGGSAAQEEPLGGESPRRRAPGTPPPGPRPAAADTEHFRHTLAAMRALDLDPEPVLRVLAFVLKLGNVQLQPQLNVDGSLGVRLQRRRELSEACALVGVDEAALAAALGAPASPQGESAEATAEMEVEGEAEVEAAAEAEAAAGAAWGAARRDRAAAAVYGRLFAWLVQAVNARLGAGAGGGGGGGAAPLSILDVYGLEALATNTLERLVINYAAERVQAAVSTALRREQEEYVREGLPWRP